ncbi:hypothetical protein P3T40_006966 [Paraburkholderia sp. EB58]|jgi:hypothetical protein
MSFTLWIFSKFCFACAIGYLIFSFLSARWAAKRHDGSSLYLEFQPQRARGSTEVARARLLKKMRLCAAVALPIGIVSLVVSALLS